EGVRGGSIRSSSGEPFELVISIGIGGSDLGPAMAVQALRQYTEGAPRVAFVSNIDGCELHDLLEPATAARTLFIVCSKTFTTLEALTSGRTARAGVRERVGQGCVREDCAAVSVNSAAMDGFGVHPEYRFPMW